jgi:arylsulfatase A-like enzyme
MPATKRGRKHPMKNIFRLVIVAVLVLSLAGVWALTRKDPPPAEENWIDSTSKATLKWDETNAVTKHLWQKKSGKYNVVLITVNLLRVDHVSAYGYGRKTTPALDELAKESFMFNSMFTNSDYTMPNMMSVITSLYPVAHGVFDAFKDELSPRVRTLAQVLKLSGYKSSWYALQLPHLDPNVGFGRGYDKVVELHRDHSNVDSVVNWIKENKNESFFVGINSRSIHPPYMPPPEYKDAFFAGSKGSIATTEEEFQKAWYKKILELMKTPGSCMYEVIDKKTVADNREVFNGEFMEEKLFKIQELIPEDKKIRFGFTHILTFSSMINPHDRENMEYAISLYDGCVLGIDQKLIQPIVQALKDSGAYDNTIIIVTGDHGESLGEHNYVGHNLLFYEQLIHVPLLIRHPDLKTRVNIGALAQSTDIMPTILDLLDITQPFHTQGKSLVPLLEDNTSGQIHEYVFGQKRSQAYVRSDSWKLVVDLDRDKEQEMCSWARLYNIVADPGERQSLCETEHVILKTLMEQLVGHLESTPKYIDKEYQFLPSVDEKTRKRIKETGYW